jgi:adenosine deaminase
MTVPDFRALAKSDRHLHLLLSAPFETYESVSRSPLAPPPSRFPSLPAFFHYVGTQILPLFGSLENVHTITEAALQHLVDDGVTYAEASLPLPGPLRVGCSWQEYAQIFFELQKRFSDRLAVRFEIGHAREQPIDWENLMHEAIATGIFWGVDLYGDEEMQGVADYRRYFEIAKASNLAIKYHSGERCSAARLRADLEAVMPVALQHGISAAQDPDLLSFLASERITLNICPASNVALGHASSYEQHPIRQIVRAGVPVTICSDDFGVFGVPLSDEYARLLEAETLTAAELEQIRRFGLLPKES